MRARPWLAAGWMRMVAAAAMLLAAGLYLLASLYGVLRATPHERYLGNDYVAYVTGAQLLAEGHAEALYDPALQLETQRAILATVGAESVGMEFVNPPLLAGIVAPLLPLGLDGGDLVWRLGLVAAAILSLWLALPHAGISRRAAGPWLLLAFFPLIEAWHHRNVAPLLLLAFSGWWALARTGHERWAGLVLSLLLLKPQYAVVPCLYLLWKRRWQQLAGLSLGALAQALASLVLLVTGNGLPSVGALLAFASFDGGATGSYVQTHVTLRAAVLWLMPQGSLGVHLAATALLSLILLAVLGRAIVRRWEPTGQRFAWEVLALAVATNLLAYYSHTTGLVLLLPAAAWLLFTADSSPGARRSATLAALTLLLALPSAAFLVLSLSPWPYIAAVWTTTLGCLALGAWHTADRHLAVWSPWSFLAGMRHTPRPGVLATRARSRG